MPTLTTSPRQERSGATTISPYLVDVEPSLNQKPPTTRFQHPFTPFIPSFLQNITKTLDSSIPNYCNSGLQFITFRPYVPNFCCTQGYLQLPSLLCSGPRHTALFTTLLQEHATFFCTIYSSSLLTTTLPALSPTLFLLILNY